jgi:hypothetical protein
MPDYKRHLTAGTVIFPGLLYLFRNVNPQPVALAQWATCCLVGSLFPDIDTKSKIQKIFYSIMLVTFIALILHKKTPLLIFFSLLGLVPLLVNHRGLFHRPLFIVILSISIVAAIKIYSPEYTNEAAINAVFFAFGAFSHIYLDLGFKGLFRI